MRKIYTTDLSDAEWVCLKNHLPVSKLAGKMPPLTPCERSSTQSSSTSSKAAVPGGFCLATSHRGRRSSTIYFRKFRLSGLWVLALKALRAAERKRNGKDPNPSAAIVDSQSVKTTQIVGRSARPGSSQKRLRR